MCLLPAQTPLQYFSRDIAGKAWQSGDRAAANNHTSLVTSASAQGDRLECYTPARVNLNQFRLSQSCWNWEERGESCCKSTAACSNPNLQSSLIFTRLQAGKHSPWYLNEAPTTFCGNTVFCGSKCKNTAAAPL